MSNKNLQDMLVDPDKKVNESTNILAKLFRTVLYDLNVDYGQLNRNIIAYLDKQQLSVKKSVKEQTREKGNLVKELSSNSLTWNNFVKGLQVINPVSAEIRLTLRWRRGRETIHSVNINVQSLGDSEIDD